MKVLVINGSPRNGNTKFALKAIESKLKEKCPSAEYEFVDVPALKIGGCLNCDFCKKNTGTCVHKDDTNEYMNKMMDANVLIFGTPVYWWGMSGQLKVFIDKFYAKDGLIQENASKKVGVIAIGANENTDIQYKLIADQFKSICNFLKWEIIFNKGFVAFDKDDAKNNAELTESVVTLTNLLVRAD